VKYEDIKDVDFDVTPNPFGLAQMNLGVVYLGMKGMFGGKKQVTWEATKKDIEMTNSLN